ncbi:hypothetical protein BDW62DRAFT_202539 [Aspergillus aurantiobrunneus]
MNAYLALLVALFTVARTQTHGEEAAQEMGPVAFMFLISKLVNGQLALVVQDESWNVQIAVSHQNNPTSTNDFETIIAERRISDIDPGHMCYPVPNPGVDIEEGMNATFQIQYTSEIDTGRNETYYACAGATYIPTSRFTYQVPCFNVTTDEFTATNETGSSPFDDDNDSHLLSDSNAGSSGSSSSGSGLSRGAIAGIVVGCVVVLVIAAVLLFGYRKLFQKYRSLRQKTSDRNVDWPAEGGKPAMDSSSGSSYGLTNLK